MAADPNRTARRKLFSTHSRRAGSFAMIQPQRAVTMSSAALQTIGDRKQSPAGTQRMSADLEWQRRAYELSDELGELGYLLNLKANVVSRCNLNPQEWVDGEWENTVDERTLRVHDSFVGPYGGQQELKRRAALQLSTAGEALDLDTPVATPDGFTKIGDLVAGDVVLGGDGRPCTVMHAFPVLHDRECFEVRLSGDVRIVADAGHRWLTFDNLARIRKTSRRIANTEPRQRRRAVLDETVEPRVVTTAEMAATISYSTKATGNHAIELATIVGSDPVLGAEIDPYVLGYWLGDGTSVHGALTVHTADQPHVRERVEAAGYGWRPQPSQPYGVGVLGLQAQLRRMGLLGNKHIPRAYLRHTEAARWALLQGLVDSDGHIDKQGRVEFSNTNQALLWNVVELAASLGLRPGRPTRNRVIFVSAGMPVASMPRKAERIWGRRERDSIRYVRAVEPVKSRPVRCISVDSPDHTFLVTEHLVRTHNSFLLGTPLSDGQEGSPPDAQRYGIVWEFLSTEELRLQPGRPVERRRDGASIETIPAESYLARCWRASARFSELADSEVRRVRSIAEEVLTLTQMTEAIAKSKIAAGMLFIPETMSVVGSDESDDADGGENADGLDPATRVVMKHMVTPTQNRKSAASLVPLVVVGPAEEGQHIRLIDLARSLDTYGQELRQEALTRLAQGLDSPPELLAGTSGMNHWGSWQIDSQFIVKHVAPLGDLLAQFLTIAYLRPMLMLFEGLSPDDANQFRYEFDLSPVAARDDAAASAQALHPMEVLSDDTLLKANGFDESDKPDAQELFIRRALRLINSNPLALGPALINLIPGFENVDLTKIPAGSPSAGPTGSPAAPQPGQPSSGDTQPPQPAAIRGLHMQLQTACDMALERALERAGGKIINAASKNIAIRDRLRSVPKLQVVSMVTPEELREVGVVRNERLLEGAWDGLQRRAVPWIRSYLVHLGWNEYKADDSAALAASALCEAMNGYVVEHFHDGFPVLAGGMRTPDPIVLGALSPLLECVA
jgi:hypothetical protein